MTTPIPAGWKLVEALRESLLWTASSLAAVGKEQDVITLEGRKRTIGEILDEANAALDASPASVAPGDAQDERQPLFWYRPRSDDGYEGPIHNDRIEDVRKRSGAWVPLYPGFAALPKPLSDLRYHGEFIRGWNQCLRELSASVAAPAAGDARDATVRHTIEGTISFMRSDADSQVCVCCQPKTGHIFSRGVDWDAWETGHPEHFGRGPDVLVLRYATGINANEGKRVRVTVEVLPDPIAAQQGKGGEA